MATRQTASTRNNSVEKIKMKKNSRQSNINEEPINNAKRRRTEKNDIQKTHIQYDSLEKYGYHFKNDKLVSIETGKPFKFDVFSDNDENQKRYESVGKLIDNAVFELLENTCQLQRITVPVNAKKGEHTSFIFTSNDLSTANYLMVIIHGTGVVRAGQWSRKLIINEGLEVGSQMEYIRRARAAGYAVIITNTNLNSFESPRFLRRSAICPIRGSSTAEEHGCYVWEHFIRPSHAKHICIMAHSYGGAVVLEMAHRFLKEFDKRVFAVALTDSPMTIYGRRVKKNVLKMLKKRMINWVVDTEEVDTDLGEDDCCQIRSAGHTVHEWTSYTAIDAIFDFFIEQRILVDFASSNQCGLAPGFQSLYSILQATKTKMGSRTLRANLMEPLIDVNSIHYRQDAVENLIDDEKLMFQIQTILLHFTDVERIILACIQENPSRTVSAAEKRITMINQLRRILDILPTLQQALEQSTSDLLKNLCSILNDQRFQVILDILNSQLTIEQTVSSNGFLATKIRRIFSIRSGFDERLDSLRADVIVVIDDVELLEKEFSERFNMPVRYNLTNARGFSLEIIGEFKGILPANVISVAKRQKSTFITTLQLAHLSDRFELLYNDICLLTDQIILILLAKIRPHFGCMYRLIEAISIIDMIQSFAEVSKARDYVRPMFGLNTKVIKGRHPVIDLFGQQKPIANDIELCKEMNIILVTGPNMSGKSTYLRQIALLQILAQIGCFVPAEQARFRIVNEIFSKIRQHDNLFTGQSTFSSEINHIAFILNCMTPNSMIILDEICSSTSTNEGLALATSITETLCRSQAFVIIATHLQQLTSVGYIYRNLANYHFNVIYNDKIGSDTDSDSINRLRRFHPQTILNQLKEQNTIIYSYTLRPGICKDLHYGIALASQIEDLQTVVELAKCVAKYYIRKKESIINQMSNIPNLLMKRVIIMKGFCDLIYDVSNNTIQFIEQQRIYLENFQKRMHQYWSISSTTTSSCDDDDNDILVESPTIENN
ncbi:unnamed protein product [Rotaria sordida]|uniref:DNA mismatch repair proteins mutS family domain-containing protein n=1 Tax=Rotaria sordida TaxID=392033 RepID=A0A819B097_9BILA|nr:unnamed protein product [Rotaria sordida]